MSRFFVLASVVICCLLPGSRLSANEVDSRFSKLGFLKGKWQANVKVADDSLNVSALTFDVILDGKFFQINYTVKKGDTAKSHHIVVGSGLQGALKAWTFTSDGKTYESTVKVDAGTNKCMVTAITGKDSVVVTFTKAGDDGFTVEYENKARKIAPVTATFKKSG